MNYLNCVLNLPQTVSMKKRPPCLLLSPLKNESLKNIINVYTNKAKFAKINSN